MAQNNVIPLGKVVYGSFPPLYKEVLWVDTSDPQNPICKIYLLGEWKACTQDSSAMVILYDTTGHHTDGAMTQNAATQALLELASQIPDVNNFVTKSVDDLVNYYLKEDTYSKEEVNTIIRNISNISFELVNELPTASSSTTSKIYLVPSESEQENNIKDEYITILDSGTYKWEQIGSTAISLDGVVTTAELNTALANYVTSAAFNAALATKQDIISDLSTIRSGASAGATAYQKPSTGIPQSDLAAALVAIIQKAVANVSSNEDGAVVITLVNGDTYTIDLNHTHPDKQDLLVSGTNIKTVNNQSILGNGNLDVGANITVDSTLSATSENPVQNKVVKSAVDAKQDTISDLSTIRSGASAGATAVQPAALATKQDTLVSGTNIKTVNNNSLLGSGNITIQGEPGPQGQSAINALVNHTASETVVSNLAWDTAHVFPEMASLDFGIAAAPSDGYEHELVIIFDTPADITNFALAIPSTIHWGKDINLANNISASTRYEVRITSSSMLAVYTGSTLVTS